MIKRDDMLGFICLWFIFGLVTLPSVDMYFTLGIGNVLKLLKINKSGVANLPGIFLCHNLLQPQFSGMILLQEKIGSTLMEEKISFISFVLS